MPLRPPTPSVRTLRVYCQAELNCLWAVHGYASRSDEKLRPQCKHRAAALSSFPLPAFPIVCVMSSFTGRRAEGHGRKIRRLRNEGYVSSQIIFGTVAVLYQVLIRGGKGVDTARRRLCRPRKFSFVKITQSREPKVEEEGSYPPPFRLAEKIRYSNKSPSPARLASLPQLFTHCKVSLLHFPARHLRKHRLTSQPGAGVTAAHTHVMKKFKI